MKKMGLFVAFFLTLALIAPACADVEANPQTAAPQTVLASELALPELDEALVIDVKVPQTGRIIINPYGLPVETDTGTSTEQIASDTLTIYNDSTVPVIVSASVSGHISELSSMTYVSAPPQENAEEKEVFLYAEFQNEDNAWSGSYGGGENQILVCEGSSAAKEVLTLDAGPSVGVFRLFGATSVDPADPWSTEDRVSVAFTFTFAPVIEPAQDPDAEETPAPEETPTPEESPATGETPTPEESPIPEESSAPEERPATEETSVAEESPAPEETPTPEEIPVTGETPEQAHPSELDTTGGDPNELE